MARPVCQLTSHGHSHEVCAACKQNFARGQQMTAFEDSDGESLGWVCQPCIDEWKLNGEESKTAAALFNCEIG
jgi:hypothetical protein